MKMKLLIIICLAVAAFANPQNRQEWVDIDWSNVVPLTEMPGFWDGRDIKPAAFLSGEQFRNGRIVGGQYTTPGFIIFQAAVLINIGTTSALCGGSLVSTTWVLTAASCTQTTPASTSVTVIVGAHDITKTETTQQRSTVLPAGYRNHPQYNPANFNNDISMLNLPAAVTLNANVGVTSFPPIGTTTDYAGLVAEISGWGRTSDTSQNISPILRYARNQIITNTVCAVTYGSTVVTASTICMATTSTPCTTPPCGGICSGDIGGPMIALVTEANRLQVGVASFGAGAGCSAGHPAGFTRVTSFREWIRTTSGV